MGCRTGVPRKLVRMFLLLCFTWFLFLGILEKSEARSVPASENTAYTAIPTDSKLTGGRLDAKDCDLMNCASKRRVPNGPDPIHNRGAGKLRQQPGKA